MLVGIVLTSSYAAHTPFLTSRVDFVGSMGVLWLSNACKFVSRKLPLSLRQSLSAPCSSLPPVGSRAK